MDDAKYDEIHSLLRQILEDLNAHNARMRECSRIWAEKDRLREEHARLSPEEQRKRWPSLHAQLTALNAKMSAVLDAKPPQREEPAQQGRGLDQAVAAAMAELSRQSREGPRNFYVYGAEDPGRFGVDGELDVVALVRAILPSSP
ncbi:hypothetical protein [Microvirga massiliensis]|uniref:hypothetical protein n=1 Tax=Microvirga massiliensis TaxID=1033741 RepID=UPI00062B6C60|nr:hypothetical protein [Microvirga massiliensis]